MNTALHPIFQSLADGPYQAETLKLAAPVRSGSRTAAIINRNISDFIEGVEDLHWKSEFTPNCQRSMIDYVQKETTDIVVAIAAGKCHLTKKEALDASMKLFRLAVLILEDDPFAPLNESKA